MMTITHGPETCPKGHEDVKRQAIRGFDALMAGGGDVKLVGGWVNMPGHNGTFIVDAPDAHAVQNLAEEIGLAEWNTVQVQAVVDIADLRAMLGPA